MDNLQHECDQIRQQYERDGYAIFRDVIDLGLIQETSSHVGWLLEKHPELRPEHLHHHLVASDPFWVRLISDERLLDIAERFIGPNIALFASHYISKPPSDGQAVLWHQDGSYWPLDPMEVVTLWLAVDDSTPENGCMQVRPRTHGELIPHEMVPVENIEDFGVPRDVAKAREFLCSEVAEAVALLEPGLGCTHHPIPPHICLI